MLQPRMINHQDLTISLKTSFIYNISASKRCESQAGRLHLDSSWQSQDCFRLSFCYLSPIAAVDRIVVAIYEQDWVAGVAILEDAGCTPVVATNDNAPDRSLVVSCEPCRRPTCRWTPFSCSYHHRALWSFLQ